MKTAKEILEEIDRKRRVREELLKVKPASGSLPDQPLQPMPEQSSPAPSSPAAPGPSDSFGQRMGAIKDLLGATGYFIADAAEDALSVGADFFAGVYGASETMFTALDGWSKFLSDATGLKRSGIFGKIAEDQRKWKETYAAKGIDEEEGMAAEIAKAIYTGFGNASFTLPVIMATGLPAYSAALSGGEAAAQGAGTGETLTATGYGLAHGLIMHSMFKQLAPFTKGVQMSTASLVMGGDAMIQELRKPPEQRNFSHVIAEAVVGGGLAAMGKGNVTFREAYDNFYGLYRADINKVAVRLNIETREMQYARKVEIARRMLGEEKLNLEAEIAKLEKELDEIPGRIQQAESEAESILYDKYKKTATIGEFDFIFTGTGKNEPNEAVMERVSTAMAFVRARYPNLSKLVVEGHKAKNINPTLFKLKPKLKRDSYLGLFDIIADHKNPVVEVKVGKAFNYTLGSDKNGFPTTASLVETIVHELTHLTQYVSFAPDKYNKQLYQGRYPHGISARGKGINKAIYSGYMQGEVVAKFTGEQAGRRFLIELEKEATRLSNDLKALKADKEGQLKAAKALYKVKFMQETLNRGSTGQGSMIAPKEAYNDVLPPALDTIETVMGDIIYARPKGDILSFTHRIRSLESLLAKFPHGRDIAGENIEAQLRAHHAIYTVDETLFREIEHEVPKGRRKELRPAIDRLYTLRGEDPNAANALIASDPVYKNAARIIHYFENMRGNIIEYKRSMYEFSMTSDMRNAFYQALNTPYDMTNKDAVFESISKMHGVKKAELMKYVDEYAEIGEWGINDFITNIEVGSWRVLNSEGHVVAVGRTRAEATTKAKNLRNTQPDVGELTVTPEFQKPVDPTKPRKNILLGEENIMDALRTYSRVVHQKMQYDIAEAKMHKAFKDDEGMIFYPKNVRGALYRQMSDMRFVRSWGDEALDRLQQGFDIGGKHFAGFGGRPMTFTRNVQHITNLWGNIKLGYRVVGSFVNFASGHGHTWVKNGAGYVADGWKFMRTPEGKAFLAEEEPYLGLDFSATEAGRLHSKTPWYKPLGLFGMPEPGIRRLSLATNYQYARGKLGMNDAAARTYARRALRTQNFTYNSAAIPTVLRSPGGKLVGQFKTYMVKELEFMRTLSGQEWGRYLTMQMALGGPRAMLALLKSVPLLGIVGAFDKIDEWLLKDRSGLSSGLPGIVAGADISTATSFQLTPERPEDTAGPFISDMIRAYTQIIKPAIEGQEFNLTSASDWMRNLAPIMRHWDALVQSTLTEDENGLVWIRDRAAITKDGRGVTIQSVGKKKFLANGQGDRMLMASGASTLEKARAQAVDRILLRATRKDQEARKRTVREFLDAIQKGTPPSDDVIDSMVVLQMDSGTISNALKVREMTPEARAMFYSNTLVKLKALDLYQE